jgi:uncharacterized membrane protein YuzA (DUF378 family)
LDEVSAVSTIQTWLIQIHKASIVGPKFSAHVDVVFTLCSIEIPHSGRAITVIIVWFAGVYAFSPIFASVRSAKQTAHIDQSAVVEGELIAIETVAEIAPFFVCAVAAISTDPFVSLTFVDIFVAIRTGETFIITFCTAIRSITVCISTFTRLIATYAPSSWQAVVTVAEIGAEFRPSIARTVVATNGVDTVVLTRIGAIEEALINISALSGH